MTTATESAVSKFTGDNLVFILRRQTLELDPSLINPRCCPRKMSNADGVCLTPWLIGEEKA